MRCLSTVLALRRYLNLVRLSSLPSNAAPEAPTAPRIGFVPTMGCLHAGHLSLIERARAENDYLIVSLFVNPTQFSPQEDLDRYPRDLVADQALCEKAGVDVLFLPSADELYGQGGQQPGLSPQFTQVIPPESLLTGLCAQVRPTHFQGVATIVVKLLNLIQPDRAYFGQKDAQQLAIIRRVVADLNLGTAIIPCPIVREASGLALSSRNRYLSPTEQRQATVLSRALFAAQDAFAAGQYDRQSLVSSARNILETEPEVKFEYLDLVDPDTLAPLEKVEIKGMLAVAAQVGSARLIDNVVLKARQPIIAIDGPAGAGKSTVTQRVAKTLDLLYLDTGAMYRAVTWFVLNAKVALTDELAIADLVAQCQIRFEFPKGEAFTPTRVWINDREVTEAIRGSEVTAHVSNIAAQSAVRECLVKEQQRYGQHGGLVAEGRDTGTTVFPDAELKIFLTASPGERARRRQQDMQNLGQPCRSLEELESEIKRRDRLDSSRAISPLVQAPDALYLETDRLTIAEVTAKIVTLYHERIKTAIRTVP
ncbi:MAG: bifunctional pantoate--beta-alanine ligase/(d)CMP kinase [Prochlorotrichaceae cyanobacterium]